MTGDARPSLIALAGPNGAGKSTAGPSLLKDTLGITEFVNADLIAQGLSPFAPDRAAVAAGRIMLARLRDLARQRATFAFETTLAGRAYVRWIAGLIDRGYLFHVIFLWLPSPEHAIARVADRVRRGGHHVPDEVVRRRYHGGLRNFFRLYRPMAESWRLYDNTRGVVPHLVARGGRAAATRVFDDLTWRRVTRGIEDGHQT
jgi:predicted ABC-type ATPase